MINLPEIQARLEEAGLDGWLFFDHHLRDPLAYRVLGLEPAHVSRRWYFLIPANGDPRKLVHRIESKLLDSLPGSKLVYSSWTEQASALADLLRGCAKVAMQYSPNCAIPYISLVDAGTVELVRSIGTQVVTSAALIQYFDSRLDQAALTSHLAAGKLVDEIRAETFRCIGDHLHRAENITEWDVAQFVRKAFASQGLHADHGPIAAVGEHTGDPHYEPASEGSTTITPGSFVLLDMWARLNRPGSIYYDITWTGYCGVSPPTIFERVFAIVKCARDAAIKRVTSAFETNQKLHGFQVDDTARDVIQKAGYGDRFVHRTGHSIGFEVHGNGANMDNLETHDERLVTPWSCFSIEPGIYLDDFGVRSEVNMFIDQNSARVTGEVQDRLVIID